MKRKIFKLLILGFLLCLLVPITQISVSAATKLQIVTQPKSVTVNEDDKATVRIIVEGEGLTYKWYYKDAGSSKYRVAKTFTSDTYSVSMTQDTSGRKVYCIVTDKSGNRVKSSTVSLITRDPLEITKQPKSVTVKKGATAKVTVNAKGNNLKYNWYYKNYGETNYKLATPFTGKSYSIKMSDARAGRSVYCVVTDDLGNSVMSDVVTLNMRAIKIVDQPQSVTVKEGETASVKVVAKGSNLKYKWYVKNPGDSKYVLDKSSTGSAYHLKMTSTKSGQFVYCVISDAYGNSVKSQKVYLLMESTLGPVIKEQPQNPICSIGETAKMSVKVDAIAPHYMWQYSTDGVKWHDLNKTTSTYSLKATETAFKRMYRCRIWDDYGYSCVTETVRLIKETSLILSQPKNWVGCESGNVFFQIDVLDSVISCQWQSSTNNGKTWNNCGENEVFYSTTATAKRTNYLYRCIVTDSEGRSQISDSVKIAISDKFQITMQPEDISARLGEEVTFSIQASGKNVKFQWQRSDDGKKWSNFGSAKARVGQTLQKFTIGKYYRCIVTNGDGSKLTSKVVQLKWTDSGFFTEEGRKYYVAENGKLATGIQKIDNKIYLFTDSGIMRTGLRNHNGKLYYFGANGAAATGFTYVPQLCSTLYFNNDGTAAIGWKSINGNKYYFYDSGAMAWGVTQIGSNEYYFDPNTGAQTFGMVQVGPNNYMYFAKGETKPYTGLKTVEGKLYYFAQSGSNRGVTQSGIQTINKKTYYFDPITKTAVTGFVRCDDNTYYFGNDYTMVKNKLIKIGGKTYYFDSDGAMCHGLVRIKGKQYYFDPATGVAMSGWMELNDNWLYFDPATYAAYAAKSKTQTFTINGVKYLFNTNAHLLTGVRKIGSTHYYIPEPNQFQKGFVEVKDRTYYVHANQKVAKGLTTINKKLYFFNSAGVMQTGWRKVDKAHYFFDEKTGAAKSGWQTIALKGAVRKAYMNPKTYKAVTGSKKIDGKLYYFGSNCWAVTGKRKVSGVYYYFSPITYEAYNVWVKNDDGTQSYYNGTKGLVKGPGKVKINGKTYTIDSVGRRKNEKSSDPKQHKLAGTWGKLNGAKCYYGMNGKRVTGLCVINEKLYYFDKNGKMKTGLQKVNGAYYYFSSSGAITGAKTIKGKQYYFSTHTCRMLNGIQEINDAFRCYNSNGTMVTGLFKDGNNLYYYSPKTGARVTGFVTVNKKQYYFDPTTGIARTGRQTIDGMNYFFDLKTGERKYGLQWDGGKLYCFTKNKKEAGLDRGLTVVNKKTYYFSTYNGEAMSGYRKVDGVMYYFDDSTYAAVSGIRRVPNGTAYLFKSTGGIKKGWQKVNNKTYYFYPSTGAMAEGLASVGDNLYYFDTSKGSVRNTKVTVDGITYKFDKNGHGVATGNSKQVAAINTGISYFVKGYGNEGKTNNPKNVTCSQLMMAVYKEMGVELPERSGRQYTTLVNEYDVEIIDSMAQAKPGDLIFYSTVNCGYGTKCDFWNELHHVGMYMGKGKIMGSYEIRGDTVNNGPMVKDMPADTPNAIIYSIVRIN